VGFSASAAYAARGNCLSSTIFAQGTAAPLYPDTAHPAQPPISDQNAPPEMNQNTGQNDMPVFRVDVTERTTKAVNYRHRGGSTTVDFRGTDLLPDVDGHAKVDSKNGRMAINLELKHLPAASTFFVRAGVGGIFIRPSSKSQSHWHWSICIADPTLNLAVD
jgi:hypothetical protein